jgi:hypothetical protein
MPCNTRVPPGAMAPSSRPYREEGISGTPTLYQLHTRPSLTYAPGLSRYGKAMAFHLIDISPADLAKVRALIAENRFGSIEEFLLTAVRNQLLLESHGYAASESSTLSEAVPPNIRSQKWNLAAVPPETASLSADQPPRGPLFGQYYRFLPLKFVLRFVAAKTTLGPASVTDLEEELGKEGTQLALQLRAVQAGDLALSTGFPSDERDGRKSRDRFTAQYLGRSTSTGAMGGFGFALGLLGTGGGIDKATVQVGLTKAGIAFLKLENPVLDRGEHQPLSDSETSFLWEIIGTRLPDERDHMMETVRAIRTGANTPTTLAAALGTFYKNRFSGEDWSDAKVSLTRSGVVSRLSEMNLVEPEKVGSRVTYEVNDDVARTLGV